MSAEEVKSAKLDNTIDPEMIVMDDDSDMPEPETNSDYRTYQTPKASTLDTQLYLLRIQYKSRIR